jgi:hypothetical protein
MSEHCIEEIWIVTIASFWYALLSNKHDYSSAASAAVVWLSALLSSLNFALDKATEHFGNFNVS